MAGFATEGVSIYEAGSQAPHGLASKQTTRSLTMKIRTSIKCGGIETSPSPEDD
jgi:hypothetical protein